MPFVQDAGVHPAASLSYTAKCMGVMADRRVAW